MWGNFVIVAKLENENHAYMKVPFLHTLGSDGLAIVNGLELQQGHTLQTLLLHLMGT